MKKGKKKILHPPALPPMSLSFEGTRIIKTGTWRYLTPVYLDKLAPCNEGCPAGEDIEAAMVRASQRDFGGAWEKITEENPLPRVCGRVCFHPCEGVCNRKEYDEALAIHLLERLAGDQAFLTGKTFRPPRETRMEKVAIVGSGPAGLSCAYHLATMGYRVTLYEGERELGGMLRYGIPAYRLPKDVLDQEIRNILALGVEARTGALLGRELSWKELEKYDALFLATGAWKSIPLKIPGADAKGIMSGLQVLREINRGQRMELGQRAAIIGGGNTAIDVARSALRLGTKPLILYRRSEEEMPAWGEEIQEAKEEGVEFIFLSSPVKILTERGSVQAIECVRNELGPPGPDGRRQPRPVEGSHFTLPVDSIIPCIGETSDLSFLPEALQNPGGTVAVDETGATALRKIFAGGDLVPQPRTIAYAIGSGKRAAMAIDAMFQGKNVTEALRGARVGEKGGLSMARYRQPRRDGRPDAVVRFSDLNPAYFKLAPRKAGEKLPVATRIGGFGEVQKGLTVEAAWEEAKRCFNCGVCNQCDNCFTFCPDMAITLRADLQGFQIDLDHCKGCCICVAECPRGAISVEGKK